MSRFYERKFLNKDRGVAAIEVECSTDSDWVGGSASISDCNRKITLDFAYGNAKQKRVALAKMDALIASLSALRSQLAEAKLEK